MAQLRRLREKFPDELVVIGVHSAKFTSEGETENIRQAVMRHGIEHPVVNDAGFKIWNSYAVRAWPTLVLIDSTGRIAGEISGEILAEDFAKEIIDVIQAHPDAINRQPLDLRSEARREPDRPLRYPARVLLSEDYLFIADSGHHRVLQIRLDEDGLGGEVERIFGSGESGLRDGAAEEARFHQPHGLGLTGTPTEGKLYVADTENHAVRIIDLKDGRVQTAAGTGQKAHGRYALGAPEQTPLRSPWAVLPLEEYLLIAMAGSHQVWVLIQEQQLGPFAGDGQEALRDGPVAQSSFNQPSDLDLGLGYLFVADPEASAIRAISLNEDPETQTLVGQGLFDWGDQDGAAAEALLQHPVGLAYANNLIYIADTYNNKIKVLDPFAGQVTTLIGDGKPGLRDGSFDQARLFEPEGLRVSGDLLYIADTNNHQIRVADLEQRHLHTFNLRGIERLPVVKLPEDQGLMLDAVQVSPGKVRFALEVQLPAGYKRNPDVPALLRIGDESVRRDFSFETDEEITWTLDLGADQNLPLDLTLYYCQAEDSQLCLIHSRSLVLPVRVVSSGEHQVRIPYLVQAAV